MAKTIIKNTMVEPTEMTCDECKSVFSYNYQDIESKEELTLPEPYEVESEEKDE